MRKERHMALLVPDAGAAVLHCWRRGGAGGEQGGGKVASQLIAAAEGWL